MRADAGGGLFGACVTGVTSETETVVLLVFESSDTTRPAVFGRAVVMVTVPVLAPTAPLAGTTVRYGWSTVAVYGTFGVRPSKRTCWTTTVVLPTGTTRSKDF